MLKIVYMLKSFLPLLLLAGAGMTIISCSSEDEEQQAIEISFRTINEKGEYATVFSSKENILFDLNIKNNTKDTIFVDEPFPLEIVYSFKLYSLDDVFIDFPFNGIDWLKFQDMVYSLMPYESRHWQCMYMTHQTEMELKTPLESTIVKEPLSSGEYYLLYSLTLNSKTKTGKIVFTID